MFVEVSIKGAVYATVNQPNMLEVWAALKQATDQIGRVTDVGVREPVDSIPNKPDGTPGDPIVTYSTTSRLFTFGIPEGAKGAQGQQGPIGPIGPNGDKGDKGDPGTGIYPQGEKTVAEINAFTKDPGLGFSYQMLDDGTITYGNKDVDVMVNDSIVWTASGEFNNVGLVRGPEGPQGPQGDPADLPALAVGNINNPLLDLPLNNSLAMKQGVGDVTFTRDTTATYIDRYGVLKTAAIDEPRFEKDGLLIEGTSTNLLTDSNDGVTARVDKTLNNVTGPDGVTNSAGTYVGDGATGAHYVEKVIAVPNDDSTYTISVFVKKGTADTIAYGGYLLGGTIVVKEGTFTFSTETAVSCSYEKLADGWYRLSISITNNSSGNTTLYNRVYVDDGSTSSTSTDTLYIYGFQSEKLPFAASYIPTTDSAVTRGEDECSITAYDNISNSKFTTTVDINSKTKRPITNSTAITWSTGGFDYSLKYWNGSDNNILTYYNGIAYGFQTTAQKYRLTVVYDGTYLIQYIDGIEIKKDVISEYNFSISNIIIACNYMTINFKNIRTYDIALSAEEVKLV